ncbi:MAG TPA: glycosyltransferase [Puia sp.]|nr:glycosyltransferase [Puia sp.]
MASNLKINNPTRKTTKILLAPLDWGLGHATRCIPIIKELLINKYEVYVAAVGDQKALLKEEFPFLSFVELPGYHIKYDKNRAFTLLKLIFSIPKILIRVKEENHWLRQFQEKEGVDIVISDNRYGLWHRDLYCVLITHQLNIQSGMGDWMDRRIQRWHYRLVNRFNACWVPDMPLGMGLAGKLSHPTRVPDIPTHYIGLLSRMEPLHMDETIDLLILLSGPEPQRTILEKMLWEQLKAFQGNFILVRGLPKGGSPLNGTNVYDHIPTGTLNEYLSKAKLVVARSGYSTVMDLVRLQKRSILIPTPGQTEQEYLGKYLTAQRIALCVSQKNFSLMDAFLQADQFSYVTMLEQKDLLQDVMAHSFSSARLG